MSDKKAEAPTLGSKSLKKLDDKHKGTTFSERSAITHLKELHLQDSRLKHPELPYYSSPPFSATKTNSLTKIVQHFLRLKGHHCERTGNEGRVIDQRQTYIDSVGISRTIGIVLRVKSSGMRGTSDLKAIIDGKFVAIEIKNSLTRDRQRPDQKLYQAEIEAAGGIYYIVTSFATFLTWYYQEYGGAHD
jgi:hypothetical protein